MFVLSEDEVHLWYTFPDEWDDLGLAAQARRFLDAEELARMERIRFAEGRRLFGVSHLLVRMALSHHANRRPGQWRFVRNGQGKPRVDPESGPASLRFNLAHTGGLAIVAVTSAGDVGVDVERRDRPVGARRLVSRFFSPGEIAALGKLPSARLQERFFLHWTLKEAAIKALGRGLLVPLDSVAFHLSGRSPYGIAISGTGLPDAERWCLALLEPRPPYVAALAVRADPARALILRSRRLGPSGEITPLTVRQVGLSPGVR